MSLQSCQWREFLVKTLSFFFLLIFWQWTVATVTAVWSLRRRAWWTWRWRVARCPCAGRVCSCTRGAPWCESTRCPGSGCCTWASSTWRTRISGTAQVSPAPALGSTPVPPNYCLGGRDGTYTQPSVPHTVIWHATIKLGGSQCHFISTAFPLMKYLQSSHTATSLVFAFKAIMWKFGLWFWYIHCSWICNEQNLYLNICYKLIIWKHRTPLFFVVVTNLTLPDFKQVP